MEDRRSNVRDEDLIRTMRADPEAMDLFYRRHADGLYRYAVAVTRDPEAAKDAVQETMIAAWRNAGSFAGQSRVTTWLLGICRNKALDYVRRRGRSGQSEVAVEWALDCRDPRSEAESGKADPVGKGLEFWDAFSRLPAAQREVLLLVFQCGLSQQEAAEVLGIPKDTVRSRLYRARKDLRSLLSPATGSDGTGSDASA